MSWNWKKQWPWMLASFIPLIYVFTIIIPGMNPKMKDGDFSFDQVHIDSSEKTVTIKGAVVNNTDKRWGSFTLEVEFFNKDGKFLDEFDKYMRGGIKANSTENFKMSISKSKLKIDNYSDYKIRVVDANKY
jgi:hypothetical protein